MSRRTASAAALALVLGLAGDVWAGPPTETLRDAFAAVNRLLADAELQEKPVDLLAAIRSVVNDSLDFREAARLALGREWEARTPAERDEFVRRFADLLKHAYVSGIASRAQVQGGLLVRYRHEVIEGRRATVETTIVARDGGELPVEYRMLRTGDRWAVYDAVIGGISLVANYRAQFSRVIRQSSYPELVLLMTAKTPEAPSAATPVVLQARAVAADHARDLETADVDVAHAGAPRRAPEPAGSAPAARPARVAAPSYWLQIGVFREAATAIGLVVRLLERNLPVAIDSVGVPGGRARRPLARVRVGPFVDETLAISTLRSLRTVGYRPFIARSSD